MSDVKKAGVQPAVKKERLEAAVADLNASLQLDPQIKYTPKSSFAYLKQEIEEVVTELLKSGDSLLESTVDTLCDLEIDVPAGVKIRKAKDSKKAKPEKVEKKGKPEKVKTEKAKAEKKAGGKKSTVVRDYVASLIEQGKFDRKKIYAATIKKYPEAKVNTISIWISNGTNPKYNPFPKLVINNSEGLVSFKK